MTNIYYFKRKRDINHSSSLVSQEYTYISSLNLKRLRHHDDGGLTNFEILWTYVGLPHNFISSVLKRDIGDFIDYTICTTSETLEMVHYTTFQILQMDHIDSSIKYATHFTKSRFIFWFLSIGELKTKFDVSLSNQRFYVVHI